MAKKDTKEVMRIQEEAEKLLSLLGIEGKVAVTDNPKEDEPVEVSIETEDTGIFIGRHGETILSFELVLNQIINKNLEAWKRIVVDTGDYRTKQEERLKDIAQDAAERVKQSGEPYSLYDLNPSQRRFVHTILSEDPELTTESEGEGRERKLVVKLKD